MRAPIAALALTLALAFTIAACDGGDDDTVPATATPEASPVGEVDTPIPEEGAPSGVTLTWWGQAMFVLTGSEGTTVLMDPYGEIGYRLPEVEANVVTVSHEHSDHNNVALGGGATVLRGLTDDGWAEIDERPGDDVRVLSVASWHDESEGAERGRNSIFVFETGGLRIVHVGDLGHMLSREQVDAVGAADVLLVPVGSVFTIDAMGAWAVVKQLAPRVVIPMHYGTEALTFQLDPVDAFLEGQQIEQQGSTVELDVEALPEPGSALVWVLEPLGG